MPGSRPVPKSHEDVHEHARSTLNPQGGRINTNQRKPPTELSHTAEMRYLGKFEPHSVYRQFQLAVGPVSRRANRVSFSTLSAAVLRKPCVLSLKQDISSRVVWSVSQVHIYILSDISHRTVGLPYQKNNSKNAIM